METHVARSSCKFHQTRRPPGRESQKLNHEGHRARDGLTVCALAQALGERDERPDLLSPPQAPVPWLCWCELLCVSRT